MDKKPRTVSVPIVTDPAIEQAVLDAKRTLDARSQTLLETFNARVRQHQTMHPDADAPQAVYDADMAELADLEAAYTKAQAALNEHATVYSFRPLGFKAWRALKAAHPSKNKDELFDLDSIAAPLLRDASYEPRLSAAQVEDILTSDAWSEGEVSLLIGAAVTVQS
ncbi:hypothetical protein [Cellulomonas sp.]|uniref:hypothetical protein n=1 Tax=Cellulomonas sp. TaxID=40001 RepID=UPI001B221987|nr:hypothetical protein [Cellulomonas sp.]MBO9555611.1 hypothetical protein [Cellulomonas sp.]